MPVSPSKSKKGKRKSGFYIGVTCPGCGGELVLEGDLAILICDHCGSVLRVVFPGTPPAYMVSAGQAKREIRFSIDRFLKTESMPLTGSDLAFKYVYYPYWKTDAVLLKLRNRIHERVISSESGDSADTVLKQEKTEINLIPYHHTARAGLELAGVPESIGIRSQYIKMVPFSDENIDERYQPLEVIRSWDDVWGSIRQSVDHMGLLSVADFGTNKTELMYPAKSVVYFPYVIVESYQSARFLRFILDGVTGRVLDFRDKPPPLEVGGAEAPPRVEFGSLDVDFHRCTNCGYDLPPRKSFVNICENCQCVDLREGASVTSDDLLVADQAGTDAGEFFPFWSFRIPDSETAEIKRLFGGIYRSDWLTIPAFRVPNFEALYRLSKRLSAAVPQIDMSPVSGLGTRYLPVTLSAKEAERLTGVIIHRRRIKSDANCSRSDIDFRPAQVRLLYIPFRAEHYFFVDSILGAITFEKAMIQ
jgi:ribosomal protein S27E